MITGEFFKCCLTFRSTLEVKHSPILILPLFIYDHKNDLICFYHMCNCSSESVWGRILCVCWVSKLPSEPVEMWLGWSVEWHWLGHHGLNAAPEQSLRASWAAQSYLQCLHKPGRQGTGPAGDLCSAGRAPRLRGEGKNKPNAPVWARVKSHIATCLHRSQTESVLLDPF